MSDDTQTALSLTAAVEEDLAKLAKVVEELAGVVQKLTRGQAASSSVVGNVSHTARQIWSRNR
jgi:uncharacterized protein involved in propanediol utilization